MAQIRVEGLHKAFANFVAVGDSNFTIDDRSFFVMLGPSGCGKTTTLRMIAGLELPTEGRILLGGDDVTSQRAAQRDIAFVFQLFALYPHMDVAHNIGFPLRCQGVPGKQIRRQVDDTARMLRIENLMNHKVSKLSAGDRQRVALGRAIVRRPKAFLMDEPLGALDSEFRHLMCDELRDLHERIGATTVYVTHDQMEAMSMADRIAIMNQGYVEQIGTPQEVYSRPASMFVADFIGSPPMNFLPTEGPVRTGDRAVSVFGTRVDVPEVREDLPEGPFALGVRPEHVTLSDSAPLRGQVFGTEYLGTTQIVTIDTADVQLKARLSASVPVSAGDTVGISLDSRHLVVFGGKSGRAAKSELFEDVRHG